MSDRPRAVGGFRADRTERPVMSEDPFAGDEAPPDRPAQSTSEGYPPAAALRDAWDEHRPYVYLAAGLFAIGIAIGAVLAAAGYDLLAMIEAVVGEDPLGDLDEGELTAWFFVSNNTVPYVLSIVGVATVGILTVYVVVFNGVVVGNVGWFVAGDEGLDFVVVGLAPHGIFELPALFVAAGVGFRLLHRLGQRVLGRRDSFVTKRYVYRTGLLVLSGWLLLVVAAFVEAYVTGALLEALFADRIE